jgi:hypothetical protein
MQLLNSFLFPRRLVTVTINLRLISVHSAIPVTVTSEVSHGIRPKFSSTHSIGQTSMPV